MRHHLWDPKHLMFATSPYIFDLWLEYISHVLLQFILSKTVQTKACNGLSTLPLFGGHKSMKTKVSRGLNHFLDLDLCRTNFKHAKPYPKDSKLRTLMALPSCRVTKTI